MENYPGYNFEGQQFIGQIMPNFPHQNIPQFSPYPNQIPAPPNHYNLPNTYLQQPYANGSQMGSVSQYDQSVDIKPTKYKLRYAFTQQLLRAWRPRPTLKCAISIYTVIGLILLAFGIAIAVLSNQVKEISMRYDQLGPVSANGKLLVSFSIEETMQAPIFLMYEIKGFFQNHRRYIISQSLKQMRGNDLAASDLTDCEPVVYNSNLTEAQRNIPGKNLDPSAVAIPCGAAPRAYFNDTFVLSSTNGTVIPISDKGIAWADDINYKFKNIDLSRQWIDMESERFINWIKTAPFSDFRKTWGLISNDLPAGSYTMEIQNFWDSSLFDGEKWFVISETNAFGGKNRFLGYANIAVGGLAVILAILFLVRKLMRPRGITEYQLSKGGK